MSIPAQIDVCLWYKPEIQLLGLSICSCSIQGNTTKLFSKYIICHVKDLLQFVNLWSVDFINSGKCSTILFSNIAFEVFLLSSFSEILMVQI